MAEGDKDLDLLKKFTEAVETSKTKIIPCTLPQIMKIIRGEIERIECNKYTLGVCHNFYYNRPDDDLYIKNDFSKQEWICKNCNLAPVHHDRSRKETIQKDALNEMQRLQNLIDEYNDLIKKLLFSAAEPKDR